MRTLPDSAIMDAVAEDTLKIGRRLQEQVLEPMKAAFVGKAEIIDLLGLCLAGARTSSFSGLRARQRVHLFTILVVG